MIIAENVLGKIQHFFFVVQQTSISEEAPHPDNRVYSQLSLSLLESS
jgi:hypothetical protein